MISRARFAATTRPCRSDSSAPSIPASSSADSAGASSSTDLNHVAASGKLAKLGGNVLAVPGQNSCAAPHDTNPTAVLRFLTVGSECRISVEGR